MTRADRIAAALERWRIETEPGADMPSMPSVKAAGEALAALLRESQPEPALDYLGNAIGEEPSDSQPAPVVGDDDAALLAKTQDWLCHNLTVTPDSHYRNVQALLERCSAALADVARLEARPSRYEDLMAIEQLQVQVDHYRTGMTEARAALAAAVAEEREAMKQACRAIGANFRIQAKAAAGKSFHNEENDYLMRSYGVDKCVEAIRARAGRSQ